MHVNLPCNVMVVARPRYLVLLVVLSVLVLGTLATPGAAWAQTAQPGTGAQQLAERYAPIMLLKQQSEACDDDGEPFVPAPVEIVFGDPDVLLKARTEEKANDPIITTAPTAADLAAVGEDTYLDFPGNPRHARCDFEQHARSRMSGLTPTTYARIAVDQERGTLALQYWFFYYFNDFNNTHESDWEMIQIVWNTTSLDEALGRDPDLIGFAQHGGGELARWNDTKLQREGTHPIVYPAAGSHASYFDNGVYVGWGEGGTGFGCDDTTGPSVRVPLQAVVIPNNPDTTDSFAWLTYQGRWGERQPWEFNGPKGLNLGTKWNDPIKAISDWRPSSLQVPASNAFGPTATDVFCTIAEGGSSLLILFGVYPWLTVIVGVLAVAIPVVLFVRVRSLLGEALAIYRARWRTFLGIGLLAIPIGWMFNGFEALLSENPPLEWLIQYFEGTAGARLFAAVLVGIAQQIVMVTLVGPAVIQAMTDLLGGREPSVVASYQEAFRNWRTLLVALLITCAAVGLLSLVVIGIPVAIWLWVRWQFFGQATIVDDAQGGRTALHASDEAVRGHWWRALGASVAFWLIGSLPGPLIGIMLMILGEAPVRFANGVSSFIYALFIPVATIGLTLVYLRFTGRSTESLHLRPHNEPSGDAAPARV